MRRRLLGILMLLGTISCGLSAQTVDTTVVKVPYDTTITYTADSTGITSHDTTVVVSHDTIYTISRDSLVRVCCRDSLVLTPRIPPVAGNEPQGFRPLIVAKFTYKNDPGTGVVPLEPVWQGAMSSDNGPDAAPFGTAAKWTYKAGTWGGVSPGVVWASTAIRSQNVHDVYVRGYYKWSSNFVGHSGAAKIMLLGFGPSPQGGNQFIFLMKGSQGVSTQPFSMGLSWQSGGSVPTNALVGNLCCLDYNFNNFSVQTRRNINRDVWVKFEMLMHSGTTGAKDSWFKIWQDGVLTVHVTGYDFTPTADTRLTEVKLAPVWGGGTSYIPAPQFLWLADFYVSGK